MTQSINELKSYTEYNVSTPTSVFTIGFQYEYNVDKVNVYVDDVEATAAGYTVQHDSQGTVTLTPAVPSGVVRLSRETNIDTSAHTFSAGAKFTAGNMDENFEQIRHSQQEVRDGFSKLSTDTYEIIDTLQEVGQVAQDAADAAEQAAITANDAAAQVNDKVSYQDLNNAIAATPHNTLSGRDVAEAHPASAIIDASGLTQQQINSLTVTAQQFGAKGDGITDDTQSIQAAIDYVASLGGGTVEVPDGTYMVKADNPDSTDFNYLHDSGGIALKDNVHLKLSKRAVLKAIPTQERRYNVLRVFNKKNVAISGGRILGERDQHISGGQVGEWGYGIAVTGSEEVSISNIDIEKCYGDGINLQIGYFNDVPISPKGVYIDNVRSLHNRRQGMSIEAGYDVFITRSEFSHTGGTEPASGIDIEPWSTDAVVKNITIDGCRFINNAKKGIIVGGAGNISNIRITNNFLSGNQSGVGAGQIAIYTPQEIYKTRDVDVLGNTVVGGGDCDYGILTFDSENVTVKNNTLRNCSLGLSGFTGNSNITYSDNTVTVSTTKGASQFMNADAGLDAKYKNIKIVNNTFNFLEGVIAGGSAPSIFIRGHGTEFSGNTIIGAGNVNSMGNHVKFINNSLQDISTLAVSVSGANTEVRGNSIYHVGYVSFASGNGVEVLAADCIVSNNAFYHTSLNTLPPELIGKKLVSAVQLIPNLAKGSYVIDNIHPSDVGLVNWGYVELDVTVASTNGFSGNTTPISSSRPIGYRFYNTTLKKELINQQDGWYDLMGGLVT